MTLREMIDELEDLAEEHGDDTEVRLAQQPRWAFEYAVGTIAAADPLAPAEGDEDEQRPPADEGPAVVYIGEAGQLGYLPRAAACALGWT